MKQLIITLGLLFLITGLWAQNDEGAKIVPVSQAIQKNGYQIQVGLPYLGQNKNSVERIIEPADVRFPWGVLYLFDTFAEESFDVSKGYFGDKILINWDLRKNFNKITNIKIYRRAYREYVTPQDDVDHLYDFVASVSKSETSFEDQYTEGGVLYQYKVVAEGVSEIEDLYNTYITGIGYRNPTAVITGNISYKGGNPVKNVIVVASSDGSGGSTGSSLLVPATSAIKIENINNSIFDAATFQAWVKPENNFANDTGTPINLYKLSNLNTNTIDVTVNLLASSKVLVVTIGGSEYRLQNYFPSGKLNARGNDILIPVTDFNDQFVHFSVVLRNGTVPLLFVNGRAISEVYRNEVHEKLVADDPNYTAPYFNVTIPTQTTILSIGGLQTEWDDLYVGGQNSSFIDEIRIWNDTLAATTIRTDYTRYISGNDNRLVTYLSANEKVGRYAYDLSRDGFNYNKNNGELWELNTSETDKVLWKEGAGNFPTADQLGVLGVTDSNGNYEITAIPYSGTGESFNITPLYGVHQFEPGQQLVFLGEGAAVVNKINFVDISSFSFKGKILYDTRGVFKSFVEVNSVDGTKNLAGLTDGDQYVTWSKVIGEGYNYYETISYGKKSKGEYFRNDNDTPGDENDDYLELYAKVFSDDVNVYVDGNIVLDENNTPVVSKSKDGVYGYFDIQVPIGNHSISVKKTGHEFKYGGRFPAESGTYKEFFEDSNEAVIFVDSTRVTLVGKVVGGSVEAAKAIGFGDEGTFQKEVIIDDETETITISSKNNIGIANIKLGYIAPGTNKSQDETQYNFKTNLETGEYRVAVMPLKYQLDQSGGIKIDKNENITILDANETVNLSEVNAVSTPEYKYPDDTFESGEPYNYEKSFVYRSTPVLKVTEQNSDESVTINDVDFSTEDFKYPVYRQFGNYEIILQSFELYTNHDSNPAIEDIVPIIDGELKITNNLALPGSELAQRDPNDSSIIKYSFKGGMPSISIPFTRTLDIRYRINEVDYDAKNYSKEGIILGGQSDGSQTIITAAPEVPDIILRDPPGSNSFASIESGESFSINEVGGFTTSNTVSGGLKNSFGAVFAFGGGLLGPVTEVKTVSDVELGLSVTHTSEFGDSVKKTYNFSQTISTSSDPLYVGSMGDLYIGNSSNYAYGSYDDIQTSTEIIGDIKDNYILTNNDSLVIYISKQKALYFVEEPTSTFFIYSQKNILETLIPSLELIIENHDPNTPDILPIEYYEQQISLWRKLILENERSKYLAKNDRANLQVEILAGIDASYTELRAKIQSGISDNISFDAGVGKFTRSVETGTVIGRTNTLNFTFEESVQASLGLTLNGVGFIQTIEGNFQQDITESTTTEDASTLNISYTLVDNDRDNLLSVDVINLYDGYGPIFSTIGGATSCPYEGAEKSIFFNNEDYDPEATIIDELEEEDQEQLSFATQRIEVPLISVEVADITNVPESNNAEFTLLLENNSVTETDVYYDLYVDNTSNPLNALINIAANGTTVYVPYGQPVTYTLTLGKSVSDVYDYEDIRIVLQSRCDFNVFDDVKISAQFVPSCSKVALNAPLDNWVFNRRAAYETGGTVNSLKVKLAEFDVGFNTFKKIDLEYRLASSSTWTRLRTYYGSQDMYDDAAGNNETEITLINSSVLNYSFDIVDLQLQNGEYELRARSTCTNDTEYISEIVTGRVDLTSPQKFGTPLPINGILGAGEDLKVSFNEPIFYNSAISTIEIKGQTNQLPINDNVSLYFDGANNTAVINSPSITTGDLTLEFWMNNSTFESDALIIAQQAGINIGLDNEQIFFTLGDITAKSSLFNDGLFHHYTFTHKNSTGEISIYQDDAEIAGATGVPNLEFTNNNNLVIGGNSFIGNIHNLRLWNKTISLEDAYAHMFDKLIGNEANLIGYWPMDEGRGAIANDKARFRHAEVNAGWDIKPKGNAYEFLNDQYLTLDKVGYVQLTNEMDATISFWMKTATAKNATLFSNGRGDGSDIVQSNGRANKWAINMDTSGNLTLASEGNSYLLTSESVADDTWHHVTLLFNRIGSLRTYVDAAPVSSNQMTAIGGFSGNKIWLGARGSIDSAKIETVDNFYSGKIDEFRLWNTLRNVEQISRDRFNEVAIESIGLELYARMNAPDPLTGGGPRYFHAAANETVTASLATINGAVKYSDDVPPIKPARELIKFEVNYVINEDEMILEPIVTDWASLEGQIIDITVHRMFDNADNRQQSPITWTAFVKRNEVSWFAEGYNEIVDIVKNSDEEVSFEITLLNKGGKGQPYNISNIPSWLTLSSASGTLPPDSRVAITATVDKELTPGEYLENLYLQTDFGYDEKLQIKLRVLAPEPEWEINPTDFKYSLNIVGKVKVDGVISEDSYDKIAAFYDGEVRGTADLVYNNAFQEYFVYLTVYSNDAYGEEIKFKIWDASKGVISQASIGANSSIVFTQNQILGSLSSPIIFENKNIISQIISLNKGWTWISVGVNDPNYLNLNALTQELNLETSDRFLSHSPSQLETYFKDEVTPLNSGWSGSISANGGITGSHMYKVNFANENVLNTQGAPIDLLTWKFEVQENWNWLPYPLAKNQATNEALAYFDAVDGDVIKSQNLFAIFDPINGWNGTLNYLEIGTGYMIKSSKDQTLTYPTYLNKSSNFSDKFVDENTIVSSQAKITQEFKKYPENMNAVVLLPKGYTQLFIYDINGILKGEAKNQSVMSKELSFITIYGSLPETLIFSVGDGIHIRETSKSIRFKSNQVLGTVAKPIIIEDLFDVFQVFPDPFKNDLTIKLQVAKSQIVLIQIYSMTGQLVYNTEFEATEGLNSMNIAPVVASGAYLLNVIVGEKTMSSKIIKN